MKNFSFIMALLAITVYSHATVRTVNNHNPGPGQFTDVVAAYAASAPGDTLYLSGSATPYNALTIATKITIIGTGFNPTNKQDNLVSAINGITLTSGPGTAGSSFVGLNLIDPIQLQINGSVVFSQISVIRCYANPNSSSGGVLINTASPSGLFIVTLSNININGCSADILIQATQLYSSNLTNSVINNNIVYSSIAYNYNFSAVNMFNNDLIFQPGVYDYVFGGLLYNCQFDNNIIYVPSNGVYLTPVLENGGNSEFNNIVAVEPGFVLANDFNASQAGNNIENVVPSSLFANYTDPPTTFHTLPTSAAHNEGTDGTDAGIYGGPITSQYNDNGEPGIPTITAVTAPLTTGSSSITVTIKSFRTP